MQSAHRRIIFFFILLITISDLRSQVNSPYSRYGLGNLHPLSFESSNGFAGITAPYFSTTNINFGNPASYADISYALFEIGGYANILHLETTDEKYTSGDGNLAYMAFGFPYLRKLRHQKFGLSFGLIPFSSFEYDIYEDTDSGDPQLGTLRNNYVGKGDLYQFYGGTGYKFSTDTTRKAHAPGDTSVYSFSLNVGGNISYLFGSLSTSTYASFPDQENSQTTKLLRENVVGGMLYNFGLGAQFSDFRKKQDLSTWRFGATVQPQITVNGLQSVLWTNILKSGNYEFTTDTLYAAPDTSGNITLPLMYKAGVSYSFLSYSDKKSQYSLYAEYAGNQWSDYRGFQSSGTLTDNWRISFGGEFMPASSKIATAYRAGFYTGTSYLVIDGVQLNEFGFSTGFGIPIGSKSGALYKSRINISAGVGSRGSADVIRETFYHFGLGFTLVDSDWFQPFKLN